MEPGKTRSWHSRHLAIWMMGFVMAPCLPAMKAFADSTVVFNEIMYHPLANDALLEWIELYNQMAVDMDISRWSVRGGVRFDFPEGTILRGGGLLVIAASPQALKASAGFGSALGPLEGRLDNSGERLDLLNNNGRVM